MMSAELLVSTRVLATLPVATFNVITKASSWGYEIPSASFYVKMIGRGWWGTFGVPHPLKLTSLPILVVINNDLS